MKKKRNHADSYTFRLFRVRVTMTAAMFFHDATFQAETSFRAVRKRFHRRPRKKAASAHVARTLNRFDIVTVRVWNTPLCWVRAIKMNTDPDIHHLVTVSGRTENEITGGQFDTYGDGGDFRQWLQTQGISGSPRQLARAYFSQTQLTDQEQTYIDMMGLEDSDEDEDVSTHVAPTPTPSSQTFSFGSTQRIH